MGQALGAGKWHKGAEGQGLSCRVSRLDALAGWCHPMAAGWAAKMVWRGTGIFQPYCARAMERSQRGIPQPGSAQGHPPLVCFVQVDFAHPETGH